MSDLDVQNINSKTGNSAISIADDGTTTVSTFTSTGIDDNATSTAVTLDSSGNVGIGTVSPQFLLHASGSGSQAIGIERTGASSSALLLNAAGSEAQLYARESASVDGSVPMTFWAGGLERLRIDASGNVGIGTSSPSGLLKTLNIDGGAAGSSIALDGGSNFAVIYTGATAGDPTSLFSNTGFKFATATAKNATGFAEVMRIDASRNVGIGTTSPSKKLHVTGDTTNYGILAEQPSGYGGLNIKSTTLAQTWSFIANDNGSNSDLLLYGGSSAATKLVVDSSGNVGIGTTLLANPLTVNLTPNTNSKISGSAFDGGAIRLTSSNGLSGTNSEMAILAGAEDSLSAGIGFARQFGGDWGTQIRFYTHGTAITTTDELTERMRLDASGNLLVSLTTNTSGNGATGKINVRQDSISATSAPILAANEAGSGSLIIFSGNGGGVSTANRIYHGGASVVYATSSDERLKKNITPAPSAVAVLNSVEAVSFDWKATDQHTKYGFIAQQFVDVVPDAVIKGSTDDEPWGMDYGKVTPFLLKAIQEQQAMIEELKAEVAALKGA